MTAIKVDEATALPEKPDETMIAAAEAKTGGDPLDDIVSGLIHYAVAVERLHSRMRASAEEGDRMMKQLGIRSAG